MVINVITYRYGKEKLLESVEANPQSLGISFALITLDKNDVYYDKQMISFRVKQRQLDSKNNILTLIME